MVPRRYQQGHYLEQVAVPILVATGVGLAKRLELVKRLKVALVAPKC